MAMAKVWESTFLRRVVVLVVVLASAVLVNFVEFAAEEHESRIRRHDATNDYPPRIVVTPTTDSTISSPSQNDEKQFESSSANDESKLDTNQIEINFPDYQSVPELSIPITSIESTIETIKSGLTKAHRELIAKLEVDYGKDTFAQMFLSPPIGRMAFGKDSTVTSSWKAMKRKIIIKLLQVILHGKTIPFVWITAGNSVAAAHGNLMNESYTAVLERAVQPIFRSGGLHFIGRNQGMSGMPSGPELALCMESIYGLSADVLMYDFSLTDGTSYGFAELFFHRATMHRNRPAVVARIIETERQDLMTNMEQNGITALSLHQQTINKLVFADIPDSFGKTTEELEAMPEFLRHARCQKRIENGEPYCSEQRFSRYVCPNRPYRVGWHPGWKWHAVIGNTLALSMVEIFQDAVEQLSSWTSSTNLESKLRELILAESTDYLRAQKRLLTKHADLFQSDEMGTPFLTEALFQSNSFCHSARDPSYLRKMGLVTEVDLDNLDQFNITINNEKQSEPCEGVWHYDSADFFKLHSDDGWKRVVLPNEDEHRLFFAQNDRPLRGIIAVILVVVGVNDKNYGLEIREDALLSDLDMEVNGVQVSNTTIVKTSNWNLVFLMHEKGYEFPTRLNPANANRESLEFKARVLGEDKFVRFSSFLIW